MSDELLLCDLGVCRPPENLDPQPSKRCWRTIPYETSCGLHGVLLQAGCDVEAASVSLPLGVTGRYDIYLGLWNDGADPGPSQLLLRLTHAEAYDHILNDADYLSIREVYWKTAQLAHTSLDICHPLTLARSGLAFVRLVPAQKKNTSVDNGNTKRLIAMQDGYDLPLAPEYVDDIKLHIEPYRQEGDFGLLLWGLGPGCDLVNYPTQVGSALSCDSDVYPRGFDRTASDRVQGMISAGIDSLRVAVDYAHDCGLGIHGSCRMGACGMNPPYDEVFRSKLLGDYPECRCVDRNGETITRMSYAFSAVRDRMKALLLEVASYGLDGINLNLVRGGPYAFYEQPVLEQFEKEHAVDPKSIDPQDPRWLAAQSQAMTTFIKELRAALDQSGYNQLSISAVVYSDEATNLEFGLDVATWIKNSLVDLVIPYYRSFYCLGPIDIGFFRQAAQATQCRVCPDITNKNAAADEYSRLAAALYRDGADGFAFWDTQGRVSFLDRRDVICKLGHKDILLENRELNVKPTRSLPLKRIGQYRVDVHPPLYTY